MEYNIQKYTPFDFEMVQSWWKAANEVAPTSDMLPCESTFIVTNKSTTEPIAVVTMYLVNSKQFAMVDNLIGNPEYKGSDRSNAIEFLQTFLEEFALSKGIKSLFCMSSKPSLTRYYTKLGYNITIQEVTTMIKPLGVN